MLSSLTDSEALLLPLVTPGAGRDREREREQAHAESAKSGDSVQTNVVIGARELSTSFQLGQF